MAINPTTLKALIDTQITNETVNFAITPTEVGERIKDTVDYTTEQIANISLLQGPQGYQGFTGPTGTNGTNGTNGSNGTNGNQGYQGFDGPQGPTGTAPVLTSGDVTAGTLYAVTLPYDLNFVATSASGKSVSLPITSLTIGKQVSVFAKQNNFSFTVNGQGTQLSVTGVDQYVTSVTVESNTSYRFTYNGTVWKVEAIGPNLQQIVNIGGSIINGAYSTTIGAGQLTLQQGYNVTSLGISSLFLANNTLYGVNIKGPSTVTTPREILLPDNDGTVALIEKTIGRLSDVDLSPISPRTPLPYDINDMHASDYNAVALPSTNLYIGKQVIVCTSSGHLNLQAHPDFGNTDYWILYSNGMSGTNILLGPNSQYRFTYTGPNSSNVNIWYIEFMSNQLTVNNFLLPYGNQLTLLVVDATITALSLSYLNSTYTYNYPIGLQVVCKDIVGGGLTYTRTGSNTWVSHSITTVV